MEHRCAAMVAELDQALRGAGYALLIATTGGAAEESLARGREMIGRGVEAVVFWTARAADALEEYVAGQVPSIVFDRPVRGALAVPADSGRRGGAMLACRYLVSLRHRHFGVITSAGVEIAEEVSSVLAAIEGAAVEKRSVAGGADLDAAQAAAGAILDRAEATAMICGSDLLALGALRECALRGVSVPSEMSVIGFGDSPLARCATPSLSSIRVSAEEIAARVTDALRLALAGGNPPGIEVGAKLVLRESTAEAPA